MVLATHVAGNIRGVFAGGFELGKQRGLFSLGSRVGGNDVDGCGNDGGVVIFVHPLRASHASPSQSEGEVLNYDANDLK